MKGWLRHISGGGRNLLHLIQTTIMGKEIAYIAKRYRNGKFSTDKAWKRLQIAPSYRWKRMRIAAALASVIVLSATAAMVWRNHNLSLDPQTKETVQPIQNPKTIVRVIDFEDTPLPTVISKIKEMYGVEVVNVPENAGDYRISLRYEGNAVDLVSTINEILETQMSVKE